MALATVITPLLIVLAALVGVGCGMLFIAVVRRPSPEAQKERELQIAKETARKTFDQTLTAIFGDREPQQR